MNQEASNPNAEIEEELTSDGLRKSGIEREIDDDNSEISNPFDPNDIAIVTKNPSIDSVIKRIEHKEIELNPDFQRKGGIWQIKEKSRLIESLLLNIPLPVFYVAADKDDNWIVVDGLQRLTTLKEYIQDKTLILKNLEFLTQFEGLKFEALPRNMQRRILETEPVFHIIQPTTPKTVTRTIFKRINTSGLPLSAQEIRHALYNGKSTALLKELSECEEFKQATNNSISDDRMADRECVLRYLAFSHRSPEDYKNKDLDGFLSRTMEIFNAMSDERINDYRQRFKKAMRNCHAVFGIKAFRKQSALNDRLFPISKALFEAWSVILCNYNDAEIETLKNRYEDLQERFIDLLDGRSLPSAVNNSNYAYLDFAKAIQQTADVKSVHFRFAAVKSLIDDVLQDKPKSPHYVIDGLWVNDLELF
ncbi:DUF262 domain-containing protein [Methylovulum miyakonense]|uniref:DUF262 domain-containing protein n=1 Tax=Methylovulum miyakonense TaxID=645578 RepID=UPI00035D2AE6|nr:DUF262 domain-containing protein [Methylovulum miyakonense]